MSGQEKDLTPSAQIQALMDRMAAMQSELDSLKGRTHARTNNLPQPEPTVSTPTSSSTVNSTRRKTLKRLGLAILGGVAATSVIGASVSQAKIIVNPTVGSSTEKIGAIIIPPIVANPSTGPLNHYYGLIASGDPGDEVAFSDLPLYNTGVYGYSNDGLGVYGKSVFYNGVQGVSDSSVGVYGTSNSWYGVYGTSSSNAGVYGYSSNITGVMGFSTNGVGVSGECYNAGGTGVEGYNAATTGSGVGVAGTTVSSSASSYGVKGKSTGGPGVYGESKDNAGVNGTSTNNYGVTGYSPGSHGVHGSTETSYGVYGYSTSSTGVYGQADSANYNSVGSFGVYGKNTADKGTAIMGESTYGNGTGVFGLSTSGNGIYGKSTSGYAGYFQGNVNVTGTLTADTVNATHFSASAKSFKIDHPLDPANKYLFHTSIESNDMMNLYNGLVTLNENGEATVEMPNWFEALNSDFRYQLTCLGQFSPVFIAEKLVDRKFKIAGGQAGQEISWQVTGIRQDAYAKAYRSPVEVDKAEDDKGTYLHPELFEQTTDQSVKMLVNLQPEPAK